jgi:hypothetical protein
MSRFFYAAPAALIVKRGSRNPHDDGRPFGTEQL